MELDVGGGHVDVDLNQEGLSHVDVSCFSHVLSVHFLHVIVAVGHKELLILASHLLERVFFLGWFLVQIDMDLTACFRGLLALG